MIIRYSLANISARELAEAGQAVGLQGTVTEGLGFGSWGIEPTVIVEFGIGSWDDEGKTDDFIVSLLRQYKEISAYRVKDGLQPRLLLATGEVVPLTG